MQDFSLVLHSLKKYKAICALIIVQIAVACAVLSNGSSLLAHRFSLQHLSNQMDEDNVVVLDVDAADSELALADKLHLLSAIVGTTAATSAAYVNALPFVGQETALDVVAFPSGNKRQNVALYYGSPDYLSTLGIKIISGQNFRREDVVSGPDPLGHSGATVITESLARRLGAHVGNTIQVANTDFTVIGIAADVVRPSLVDVKAATDVIFLPPNLETVGSSRLVIRLPQASASSIREIVALATRSTPKTFVWSGRLLSDVRQKYFQLDRVTARAMAALSGILLMVVGIGIGGLSNYWILRRQKHVQIRRALGATKRDIATYYRTENFLVCGFGVVLGIFMSFFLSYLLADLFSVPLLNLRDLAIPGVLLFMIGQLSITTVLRRVSQFA